MENKWIRDIQRKGSKQAADKLIRAYYDEIYLFAYRHIGKKQDAMDITQSIFMAMLRALPSYCPEKASFRTWLYHIAKNKVIDIYRKELRFTHIPIETLDLPFEEDWTDYIQDKDMIEQIEDWISRQDIREQAVFHFKIYEDKSFPQIAEILDEPEPAIKSRYYRLLDRLRKEFKYYE